MEKNTCIFCGKDHEAANKTCTEFSRQKKIKKLMATDDLSYYETNRKLPAQPKQFSFYTQNFPVLTNSSPDCSYLFKQKAAVTPKCFSLKKPSSPTLGYDRIAHNARLFPSPPRRKIDASTILPLRPSQQIATQESTFTPTFSQAQACSSALISPYSRSHASTPAMPETTSPNSSHSSQYHENYTMEHLESFF